MSGRFELTEPVMEKPGGLRNFQVLGSPIHVVDMEAAISEVSAWLDQNDGKFVCVADVHSVMLARRNLDHRSNLQAAGMVLPDGMPLVWTGRIRGERGITRVCGPDFMSAACSSAQAAGWRHFFLGGGAGVAQALAMSLVKAHSELIVCGFATPPFRSLTPAEDDSLVDQIRDARPDIIWVGLGCPKQECWMAEHCRRLPKAVMVGVGAAFDFHAGRIKRAPKWMQASGLEWMHRLSMEPRRLWRRYLLHAPAFVGLACFETLQLAFWRMKASESVPVEHVSAATPGQR